MRKKKKLFNFFTILLILILAFLCDLTGEVDLWNSYGGLAWDSNFMDNNHGGSFSAKVYGPESSLTYGFLYQVIEVSPSKTYCLNLWVNNNNFENAGGRFGFREDSDFAVSSFKASNGDEDYGEEYVTNNSGGWRNLIITNTPDTVSRIWVKVGLRVKYNSGDSDLSAFYDDIRFYSLDNPGKNLLQNGDFESGWNYTVPPGSTERYRVYAFPRAFTPRGYDKFCSINIKINKSGSCVIVELFSLNGIMKKVFYSGTLNSLNKSILWDGKDDTGIILPMGIYVLKMKVIEYENNIPKEKEVRSTIVIGNNLR